MPPFDRREALRYMGVRGAPDAGVQAHGVNDHAGNIRHSGLAFHAKVVEIEGVRCVIAHKKKSIHQILYMQVGLGLFTVAQNFKFIWGVVQHVNEIVQHAMG